MQPLRFTLTILVATVVLVLVAGCDAGSSAGSTSPTPAAAQTPAATAQATSAPAAAATAPPAAPAQTDARAASPAASPVAVTAPPAAPAASPAAQAAPAAAPPGSPYDTVIRVYREARPSVVTVTSTVVQPGFRADPQSQGTGSGFMIDDQGHILTNNHVVADANRLEVTLADGTTLPATLIGRDVRFDLAVIQAQIPAGQVQVLKLGDSDQLQVGEQVVAIGNPYGLDGTVTQGIVSGRRQVVNEPGGGDGVLVNAIQTDASVNPGNSGGPLFNGRGEVVGVNTLGLMPNGGQAGLNFAIPINNAKRIMPDLMAGSSYAHPFVGISSAEITFQVASALGLPVQEGLLVQTVEPNTGAARAGMRGGSQPREVGSRQVAPGGDVIVAIDGRKVRRPEDFIAYLELNKKAGENVALTIVRDGQQRDVQITLGERPRTDARPQR